MPVEQKESIVTATYTRATAQTRTTSGGRAHVAASEEAVIRWQRTLSRDRTRQAFSAIVALRSASDPGGRYLQRATSAVSACQETLRP